MKELEKLEAYTIVAGFSCICLNRAKNFEEAAIVTGDGINLIIRKTSDSESVDKCRRRCCNVFQTQFYLFDDLSPKKCEN
jgi:hypothetical protein